MDYPIRVSIVFLNFNRIDETQYTLGQLQKICEGRDDIEIIAVDNGSSDGTAEYLRTQSIAKQLLLDNNSGIAGYNHGFEIAKGEFILVLDDDSCPKSIDAIDHAIQHLQQDPKIGIIAARILSPDDTEQSSWHLPTEIKFGTSPFFIGCGFFIRTELFKTIGWYPESFFLYQNEVDVSFRVGLLDYSIYYDPECIIVHRGIPNQRPGWRRVFFPTRNTLWLIRQYYPQPLASYMIFSRILIGLVRAIGFSEFKQYTKALYAGLTAPIEKTILPPKLRQRFSAFYQQNSLMHQILRLCLLMDGKADKRSAIRRR